VQAGLVADPRDESALWAAAEHLVLDERLRRRLGEAGRQYAEASFDITHLGNRFERLLGMEPAAGAIPDSHWKHAAAVPQPQ
jgi:hypothetical protein